MLFPVAAAGTVGDEMIGGVTRLQLAGWWRWSDGGQWNGGKVRMREHENLGLWKAEHFHLHSFPHSHPTICALIALCGGVVVRDHPFSVDPPKDKREIPADITGSAVQMPISQYQCRLVAERLALELVKGELPHLGGRRIARLVPIARRLPPAAGLTARTEGQILGLPIVGHERVDVAAIPGGGLASQNSLKRRQPGLRAAGKKSD